MKKKLISLLTAFSMTLMLFTGVPISVSAEGTNCTGDHTGMTAWTGNRYLNEDGNYYLQDDVKLTGAVSIRGNITICLNGHKVEMTSDRRIFEITNDNSSLTLCDCNSSGNGNGKLTGVNTTLDGGAVYVYNGSFTMNGGTISGNTAKSGSAVYVDGDSGSFTMNGGTISGNTAGYGGGVYVESGTFEMSNGTISDNTVSGSGGAVFIEYNGSFTMNNSTISGNTANKGGGVYSSGTFEMSGSSVISNNTAESDTDAGGGVYVYSGSFKISDSTISGNTATSGNGGGVYNNSKFTINGKVDISGNTKDGSTNNVCHTSSGTIIIGNSFNTDSNIGVNTKFPPTCKNPTTVMASGATEEISGIFKADIDGQSIVYSDGKIQLKGAHGTATQTAAKAATCTANGNVEYWTCSVCSKKYDSSTYTKELTTTVIEATDHNYGSWSITNNPSLTETGTAEHICSNDSSHTETATLSKLSDTDVWTKNVTKEPTVTDNGSYIYESDYGDITVTVPKLIEEPWTKTETKKPTIDTDGLYTYTSDYGTITVTVPKLTDPVWRKDDDQHIDPTEEKTGKDVYTSEYGEVEVELPAKEHTHTYSEEWTSNETHHWHAATCVHTDEIKDKAMHTGGTATCSAKAVCEVCGNEYGEFDSDNHNFVDGKCDDCEAVDPNHTHKGGTATCEKKAVCEICGQEYGELAEHSFTSGACENCGATDPSYVPPHNHTFVDGKCECGATDPNYVPPHNHTFVDGVCECGETDPNYVPPHNHTFVDGVCECGEIDPSYVPPHNHTFVDGVCDCGETDSSYVPPHSHTFVDGVCECGATDPTYNPSGNVTEDVNDTAGTNAEFDTPIGNVLTSDDITAIENGSSFKIVLEVTDIMGSVPPTDVNAASSALKPDEEIGVYVDLSLFKIKDGTVRTQITDTNGQIGITLTIPESIFASDRTYSIIRVHNGTAQNLGGTYDRANRSLTFYTDKFSTYAIAYTASNGGTGKPPVPSTPPTGGTTPVSPSVPVVTPTVTETTEKTEDEVISDTPYVEDVSSAAGIYENEDNSQSPLYMIVIIIAIAALGFSSIIIVKRFAKKKR